MDKQKTLKRQFLFCKVINFNKNKEQFVRLIIGAIVIFFIALIILEPNLCISSIYGGLLLWAKTILPSLFPFMFFTKLLTSLDVFDTITKKFEKITKLLFKAPAISSYIFLMSMISGYPMGAKLISEFYQAGKLTEKQANKLTTFCSTSGPLFIIGSVGTAMFLNKKIGYILFFSHILSTLLNGIIFRNKFVDYTECKIDEKDKISLNQILPETMNSSILSALIVGGYIAIFFLIIELFSHFGLFNPIIFVTSKVLSPLGVSTETIKSTLFGIIEISKGCLEVSKCNIDIKISSCIASFLISFGGFCTFFQAITFLSKCKVKYGFYLLQKLTNGILSGIITFVLASFLL